MMSRCAPSLLRIVTTLTFTHFHQVFTSLPGNCSQLCELCELASAGAGGLTLLMRASTRWPMVMREGMAWGLMMRSGTMPSAVQGMSSWLYVMPMVPFCPCRLANLSPIWGTLMERTCACRHASPSHGDLRSMPWSMHAMVLAGLSAYCILLNRLRLRIYCMAGMRADYKAVCKATHMLGSQNCSWL